MSVVDAAFDEPLATEEKSSMALAGGILQHGYQCGMLWGAALAAGAQVYRRYGSGPEAEALAVISAQDLVQAFRERNQNIDCSDITHLVWKPNFT